MAVTIREREAGDRERLVELFHQLNVHEDNITGDRRTDRAAAEEALAETEGRLAEKGGSFLVAELAGGVAGLLVLVYRIDSVYIREEHRPYALIRDLVVDDRQRRRGIGRALLDAAEKAAVAAGYRRLVLGVLDGNAAAEAAYARQGYRTYAHDLEKIIAPDES
jgi:GNAT superfamily N-acetyltransferase